MASDRSGQAPRRRPASSSQRLWLDEVDTVEEPQRDRSERPQRRDRPRQPQPSPQRRRSTRRSAAAEAVPRDEALAAAVSRTWEAQVALLTLLLLAVGALLVTLLQSAPQFWLNLGGALLLFGVCFDLVARVVGALTARAEHQPGWIAACVILGSPAVLVHAAAFRHGSIGRPMRTVLGLFLITFVVASVIASLVEPPSGA